jgi:hypothetical protein
MSDWRWHGDRRIVLFVDDTPVAEVRKLPGIKVLGNFVDVPVMIWLLHDGFGHPLCLTYSGVPSPVWRTGKARAQRAAEQWARGETPERCG